MVFATTVLSIVLVRRKVWLREERLTEEHARLERQRDETLSLMRKVAHSVPGVVYQYLLRADGSSCFPFASEAISSIYRVSPEQVREDASPVFTRLHPDDYAGVVASIQTSARDLTPWQHEYRVKFDDGTVRWLLGHALPERDLNGAVLWHGFITDVTERRRSEEALQKSDEQLRISQKQMEASQQISATGSWVYNVETRRIWGSAEGLGIFGYPAVARDFPIAEIEACILEREQVHQALMDLLGEERVYDLEYTIQPADGSPARMLHSIAKLETDDQGKPLRVVGFMQDITKRQQLEDQVRQLAFHDALTNLPNRRLLQDRLSQAMSSSKRSGRYCSLIFLDLDNFKPLNDAHGHESGDLLLQEVANRLLHCVREMDTVARFGGDEFVVLLSDLDADRSASGLQAQAIAENIRCSLAQPYRLSVPQHHAVDAIEVVHHCTASIGVLLFGNHEASQDDLLKWADAAMYRAKEAGRNFICFHDLHPQEVAS